MISRGGRAIQTLEYRGLNKTLARSGIFSITAKDRKRFRMSDPRLRLLLRSQSRFYLNWRMLSPPVWISNFRLVGLTKWTLVWH